MPSIDRKLELAVEDYLSDLQKMRASGAATDERSSYGAISNLLNSIGASLKPKVFCVVELVDDGAGHPDIGLFSTRQVQKGKPIQGQVPEYGVVEVKSLGDSKATAAGEQVSRYWARYRQVLITDTNEYILIGEDRDRNKTSLEQYRLAQTSEEFGSRLESPRTFARQVGVQFVEYLVRALSSRSTLTEPSDLAWLLASYARDGLTRVETAGDSPSLETVRLALESALGVRFEGKKGVSFFRSTLVQTLFYGIFSAWVLWARQTPPPKGRFNWHEAVWHLRAPVMQSLFQQLSQPARLQPLGLVEILDWTAIALDRVDREAFFDKFNEGEAVTYFYEPFLKAFDPKLRKQLGVWYTPTEVVRYMVARVDRALKDDLGITEGLAAEHVYVLDPCCGTGAYLAEVLRRISANLDKQGLGALVGSRVKKAALERVFGFEIMPAPYVIAHLQVGLTVQTLGASFAEQSDERAQVFLTNALTGWEARSDNPIVFPELEEERRQAGRVKQDTPILVILGNPPYNAYAGVHIEEERRLVDTYRQTRDVSLHESKGLTDLYVRFFRMAERQITERAGHGVVCFISNYSWLDGLSFAGMRERYLDEFDAIRIDCLNGDKYKTGKIAPDGSPDPSIFSTRDNSVGIQVGTAIATLVRTIHHTPATEISSRQLWGQSKSTDLLATAETTPNELYNSILPVVQFGVPFVRTTMDDSWFDWPLLPELFPIYFPGAKTNRDSFLVDIDLASLKNRIRDYFDVRQSNDEIASKYPVIMTTVQHFDARYTRNALLTRGGPNESGFIRFAYRPFDIRWLYWEAETKLLNDKRTRYKSNVFEGNVWLEARQRETKEGFSRGTFVRHFAGDFGNGLSSFFPAYLSQNRFGVDSSRGQPNLSNTARRYLKQIGGEVDDLFHHVLSVLHDPDYRKSNSGALRMEWPRIPIPAWPNGDTKGAADELYESAVRGRRLASLLDPELPMPGVTQGPLRSEIAAIGVPSTKDGSSFTNEEFALTAGWGHYGTGTAIMPGQGKYNSRDYTPSELEELGTNTSVLGDKTLDVYLNHRAFWQNIPSKVWDYKLGGHQVLKKWLSYREYDVLGRNLAAEEVQYFTEIARRIAAILMLTER